MRNSNTEREKERKKGENGYCEGREMGEEGRLYVLIHRNTASNQCTALRLAEQL